MHFTCARSRWLIMTRPTNLYLQNDFSQVEQALIFHIRLAAFLVGRGKSALGDTEAQEQVASSWRRFQQAIDGMNDAEGSEDFQAVGVRCRDALIALGKDRAGADWVCEVKEPPKPADFKGWGNTSRATQC
jgi:hypothetical protein